MNADKRIQYFLKKKAQVITELICNTNNEWEYREYFYQKLKICNRALRLLGKYKTLESIKDKH